MINLVDHYGYLGLFIGLVLGNVGVPAGAEVLLPIAGMLVSTHHLHSIWVTFAAALSGELVGGTLGYVLGKFGGRTLAERYGRFVGFHHERLDGLHAFFKRWGSFAVFLCRFMPMIRGLSPFVAGMAEMDLAPFYLWTLLGSAIFCGVLLAAGDAAGPKIVATLPSLHRWTYLTVLVVVVGIGVLVLVARLRARRAIPPAA